MTDNVNYTNDPSDPLGTPFQSENNEQNHKSGKPELNIFDWSINRYKGQAVEKKYLIEGIFPMASTCLLGATGGAGKGMLLLNTALSVTSSTSLPSSFGGKVMEHGSVIIFSAEDDHEEIHRRLEILDPKGTRHHFPEGHGFHVIPLPNTGGAFPIIENIKGEIRESITFQKIREQIRSIKNLKLIVFDPLASFARADINADPAAGAFLMNIFQEIATETGACVIAAHHTSKPSKDKGKVIDPSTVEELYHSLRGTSALGNGARAVYVIGIAPKSIQDEVFKKLKKKPKRNTVYIGGIGKANGPANWEPQIFFRSDTGLLENITELISKKSLSEEELETLLVEAIGAQEDINAFTKTGGLGVFDRRHELPEALRSYARHPLETMLQELLNKKMIGQYAKMGNKKIQYLGIPGGSLSRGIVKDSAASIVYDSALKNTFLESLFEAEKRGQPFSIKGGAAPWKQKHRLPFECKKLNQKQIQKMLEDFLEEKIVVLNIHGKEKSPQWIGSPNGDLTKNPSEYEFVQGAPQ